MNPETIDIKKLEEKILLFSDAYYNGEELIDDELFDYYYDTLKTRNPESKILKQTGAPNRNKIEDVKLPFHLAGITTKKTVKEISTWKKKYHGPYIISEKIDGLTGFLEINSDEDIYNIFTRGDGTYGKDATFLKEWLNLPKIKSKKTIYIRGEFIITKESFKKHFSDKYTKDRGVVNSIFTSKHPDINLLKHVKFLAFEKIEEKYLSFEDQFLLLKKLNFDVVKYNIVDNFDYKNLEKTLLDYRKNGKYAIDGLVVSINSSNVIRENETEPKYSFAFKIDTLYKTKVIGIKWEPNSKGILYPVAMITPVVIDGDTVKNISCSNASKVIKNGIGKGSEVLVTKSGDVIPHIHSVLKAMEPDLPDLEYHWNKSRVHIVLDNINIESVNKKIIISLIKNLNIPFISKGTVDKFFSAGLENLNSIYEAYIEDFENIEGIQIKSATKIYNSLHEVLDNDIDLATLMHASSAFEGNLGIKRFDIILKEYAENYDGLSYEDIIILPGFSEILAKYYVDGIDSFIDFLDNHEFLNYKIKQNISENEDSLEFVFTGFTSKEYTESLIDIGHTVANNITKNTNILVAKDVNGKSGKIKKARENDINILSIDEMIDIYKI